MSGILIKLWNSAGKEVVVVVPLAIPLEDAAARLLGDSLLPPLVGRDNAKQVKIICSSILSGSYNYSLDREFGSVFGPAIDTDDHDLDLKLEPVTELAIVQPAVEKEDPLLMDENKVVDYFKEDDVDDPDNVGEDNNATGSQNISTSSCLAPLRVKIGNTEVVKFSNKQVYQCDIHNCGEQFPFKASLQRHHKAAHNELFCTTCLTAYQDSHTCQKPPGVRLGLPKKPKKPRQVFVCEVDCGAQFPSRFQLQQHQLAHHSQAYCTPCGKAFSGSHNCSRPHKCSVCNRGFTCRAVLNKHMLIHTGEKPHVCETCGKKCRQLVALVSHQRTHKLRESLPCDQCSATFINEKTLMHHKMIHAGEIAHICDFCSKEFSSRNSLKCHLERFHIGKAITCPVCSKKFAFQKELERHMGKHSETRSHICDQCSVAFYHKDYLTKHRRVVHGEKKHLCQICNSGYPTVSLLNRHFKTHKEEIRNQNRPVKIKPSSHSTSPGWDQGLHSIQEC